MKGICYKDLAAESGEPEREVCIELEAWVAEILRTFEGFEDFDPCIEVLVNTRPGTGCKDAPRCWSLRLGRVTDDKCGCVRSTFDDNFLMMVSQDYGQWELIAVITIHVDDPLLCASVSTTQWVQH